LVRLIPGERGGLVYVVGVKGGVERLSELGWDALDTVGRAEAVKDLRFGITHSMTPFAADFRAERNAPHGA
jgi:hypothetical protein